MECYGLNCLPPKLICWCFNHQYKVFGDGFFGTLLWLDEIMRLGPNDDGISALIVRDQSLLTLSHSLLPPLSLCAIWEYSKKAAFYKAGRSFHQDLTTLASWSWTSYSPGLWEVNGSYLSHSVYGILLQKPEQTNTKGHYRALHEIL